MLPPGSPPQRLAPTTESRTRGRLPGSRESGGPLNSPGHPGLLRRATGRKRGLGLWLPLNRAWRARQPIGTSQRRARGTPGPTSPQAWGAVGSGSGAAGPLPCGLGRAGGTLRPLPNCANLLEARVGGGERGQRRLLSRAWRSLPARL